MPITSKAKPARTARVSRAAKLAASVAVVAPVVPVAETPKPAPVSDARAERTAIIAEHRAAVASVYNGASLTVHAHRACSLSVYTSRINAPTHKIGPSGASVRDVSLLQRINSTADASGAFDPVALAADAGVISRLASVGYLAMRGDTPTITDAGRERARITAKAATKAA